MNISELYEQNKNFVTRKESKTYPGLYVLKYARKVFYSGKWNDFLRECRGMVVDKDWNIVSLPFTKIHNYGIEKDAPEFDDNELVFASRKVNGFMIACTWYNDDLLWSTTGSLDSDFIGYAKDIFNTWTDEQRMKFRDLIRSNRSQTFMFECVHPSDPHIVEEKPGLYFIGGRKKHFSERTVLFEQNVETAFWLGTGVITVYTWAGPMYELKKKAAECKHEGFIFTSLRRDTYKESKIKSPHYLAKKFLMRSNFQKFISSQSQVPEEFLGLISWIKEVERERFFELDEIARREYIENWFLEKMQ